MCHHKTPGRIWRTEHASKIQSPTSHKAGYKHEPAGKARAGGGGGGGLRDVVPSSGALAAEGCSPMLLALSGEVIHLDINLKSLWLCMLS